MRMPLLNALRQMRLQISSLLDFDHYHWRGRRILRNVKVEFG